MEEPELVFTTLNLIGELKMLTVSGFDFKVEGNKFKIRLDVLCQKFSTEVLELIDEGLKHIFHYREEVEENGVKIIRYSDNEGGETKEGIKYTHVFYVDIYYDEGYVLGYHIISGVTRNNGRPDKKFIFI